jgi:hypothetical protein
MMIFTYAIGLPHFLMYSSHPLQFLSHISGHQINEVSFGTHPWQIVHFPITFGDLGFQDFAVQAVASFVIPFAGAIHHSLEGFSVQNSESLICLPPALASGLSTWSTATNPQATAFCSLAPQVLSFDEIQGVTNPVLDLVNTCALQNLLHVTEITQPCVHMCDGLFICQLCSLPDLLKETDCKEDTPLTLPFASFVSLSQLIIVI